MKELKRVTTRRKVGQLRASADGERASRGMLRDWVGLYRPIKKPVTLRLDADVLAWFKKQGRGYQTRINQALRTLMTELMSKEDEKNRRHGENRKARNKRRPAAPAG